MKKMLPKHLLKELENSPKISKFKLSPTKLMMGLAKTMDEYLDKPDSEFLYDRFKWLENNYTFDEYKREDKFSLLSILNTLQEDINVLIQQYLRFGRRIIEKQTDDEIISFPDGKMPIGHVDPNYNTIKKNQKKKNYTKYQIDEPFPN